jgi:alpha-1,2-mannosyltransferase
VRPIGVQSILQPRLARVSRLLTWKRTATYAAIVGLLYLSSWAYSTFADFGPLTRTGEPTAGDYIAFYTAGRMLVTGLGSQLYDPTTVRSLQVETMHFAIPTLYDPFRNPPFFALVYAPLALVGLLPSFALWSGLNLAGLGLAVWLALDDAAQLRRHWRAIAILVLTFEPVYRGLIGGQNGAVSLLLYVLIYRAIRAGREPAAGAWAALGLFKPQLFLVFPIVFAASRRWRALATYGLVAAGLATVSVAIVGIDGLLAWSRVILDHEGGNAVKNAYRMHSLKAFFDLLLPEQPGGALALFLVASAVLLVPLVRAWSVANAWSEQLPLRWALTSAIAVLIDPHLLDYDVAVLVLSGLLIGAARPEGRWWAFAFYVAFTTALLFDSRLPLGEAQLQLTVPLLVALVWWSWRRLSERPTPKQAPVLVPEPRLTPST